MSSKYSLKLAPTAGKEEKTWIHRETTVLRKSCPLSSASKLDSLVQKITQKGQLFSTASLAHSYTGCGKLCPVRTALDIHILFGKFEFGTNAENKHCYTDQFSFQSTSDESQPSPSELSTRFSFLQQAFGQCTENTVSYAGQCKHSN